MNKCVSAAEAVSAVKSGMTIGIGGWGPRRKPMALVRELLRSDVDDLTVVAYGGADVGLLCASGKVSKVIFAFVSLDFMPLEPAFRKARESGAIEVREVDEGMMLLDCVRLRGEARSFQRVLVWERMLYAKPRLEAGR